MAEDKRTINALMNVHNYFGEDTGRLGPVLVFLCISAAPVILYIVIAPYLSMVPWWLLLTFELLWVLRFALKILGKESEKLEQFETEEKSIYSTSDQIITASNVEEDGLIERIDGRVNYIITGYFMDYMDDDTLSRDIEKFMIALRGYLYDIHSHLVVDELKLQSEFEKLKRYKDSDMIQERMLFYQDQDEYCSKNSELYKISFVVKASKYEWKQLRDNLQKIVKSDISKCWKTIALCDREQVNDVMSRDICTNVDIRNMMVQKYRNENYFGSKVLFYGDEVPDEYKPERDKSALDKRRVVYKEKWDD